MKKVFSFCNQKGGVGKTTSAVNLAAFTAREGYKTLLVDMDSQGNATSGVGEEKDSQEFTSYQLIVDNLDPARLVRKTQFENLDLIPSNAEVSGAEIELIGRERREFVLLDQINRLRESYDFIFIDCPPSLGLLTLNCLVASNYIIIPLQCEYYALEGLGQLLHTYQLVRENLNGDLEIGAVLLTMADFRTNLTQQVIEEVRSHFKEKVFETVVPRSVKMSEAPSFGKPAIFYDAQNKASRAYEAIGREFVQRFLGVSLPESRPHADGDENSDLKNASGDSGETAPAENVPPASQEEMHEESSR